LQLHLLVWLACLVWLAFGFAQICVLCSSSCWFDLYQLVHLHQLSTQTLPACRTAGELLGAGSFGRVYKGRWNNTDVAVKVIQHDAAQAEEVEDEVLLMMGLQHDCIVAAYHYVTYTKCAALSLSPAATASTELCSISSNGFSAAHGETQQLSISRGLNSSEKTVKGTPAKQKAESHLVMEFCDCGTLAGAAGDIQAKHKRQQQQQQQQAAGAGVPLKVLLLLRDVARGLQAIHSRNVVHGDLVSCYASFIGRTSAIQAEYKVPLLLCKIMQGPFP
jgi:serine/threonine protein kinase